MSEKEESLSRRGFLKAGAGLAIGASLPLSGEMGLKNAHAAEAKPKRGGIFRWRLFQDPPTLNHLSTWVRQSMSGVGPVYSRLLTYRRGNNVDPLDLSLIPDLAERWEMPNNTTYIFHLRKGVRFHNRPPVNGRELTSADVKFTFETIIDPKVASPLSILFDSIQEIRTPDKYTAEFRMKEPYAPFINYIGSHYAFIFPQEVFKQDGSLGKTLIGTGPFLFEGHERNVKLSYSRNPNYYLEGHPYLDGFEILILPEPATVLAAFRSQQVDATDDYSYLDYVQMSKQMPKAKIEKTTAGGMITLNIRYMKGPFAKKEVRQAINLAIDRKAINKAVYFNQASITSTVPKSFPKWTLPDKETDKLFGHRDVERAKRLLHQAGFPNGFETTCNYHPGYGPTVEDSLTMVVQQLKDAGINVKLIPMEYATYSKAMYAGRFDMNYGTWSPMIEPHDWTYSQFHPKGTRNMSKVDDPKLTAMLEQQMHEVNESKRIKIIHDIQYYVAENALVLPIIDPAMWAYVQDYVREFRWHRSFVQHQLVDTWLDKG